MCESSNKVLSKLGWTVTLFLNLIYRILEDVRNLVKGQSISSLSISLSSQKVTVFTVKKLRYKKEVKIIFLNFFGDVKKFCLAIRSTFIDMLYQYLSLYKISNEWDIIQNDFVTSVTCKTRVQWWNLCQFLTLYKRWNQFNEGIWRYCFSDRNHLFIILYDPLSSCKKIERINERYEIYHEKVKTWRSDPCFEVQDFLEILPLQFKQNNTNK